MGKETERGDPGYEFRAEALRNRRIRMRLTQVGLAKLVGMSKSQISRLEAGTNVPRFNTINKLADALGVHPDHFIEYGEGPKGESDPDHNGDADGPMSRSNRTFGFVPPNSLSGNPLSGKLAELGYGATFTFASLPSLSSQKIQTLVLFALTSLACYLHCQ